jgi:hypothetical protein
MKPKVHEHYKEIIMNGSKAQKFKARIEIIGINPFVYVPGEILEEIFRQSGKDKGHIPVCGSVNRKPYKQTLVKYSGDWRQRAIGFLTGDSRFVGRDKP